MVVKRDVDRVLYVRVAWKDEEMLPMTIRRNERNTYLGKALNGRLGSELYKDLSSASFLSSTLIVHCCCSLKHTQGSAMCGNDEVSQNAQEEFVWKLEMSELSLKI
jgi:hypothetical protein